MATINYALREISVKIVYYGTGLCGKTTNLQVIHRKVPTEFRSDMVSLATETDRTLFFDFLPLDLGKIKGFSTKFQLYTVPGQVYYNATRKLVLRGVDGVVFVVDSAAEKLQENIESFKNLEENLAEYGYHRENIPIILQYNKRDLPSAMPVDKLNSFINKYGLPYSEAVAFQGKGVFESLKLMGKLVIDNLNKKYSRQTPRVVPASAPVQHNIQQTPARQFPSQQQRQPQQYPYNTPASHPVSDPFQDSQPDEQPVERQKPLRSISPEAESQPKSQPVKKTEDYYNYGTINLEPMSPQESNSSYREETNTESSAAAEKTDLDLEIERYQREIEEKQNRQHSIQTPQQPRNNEQTYPEPQSQSASEAYDVYEPVENTASPDESQQSYQVPDMDEQENPPVEQPLYFPSVNTDRQRKKNKRPINPATRPQGKFLSKFFNKDKP
jgi:signal recognition particle receptor subunit beta